MGDAGSRASKGARWTTGWLSLLAKGLLRGRGKVGSMASKRLDRSFAGRVGVRERAKRLEGDDADDLRGEVLALRLAGRVDEADGRRAFTAVEGEAARAGRCGSELVERGAVDDGVGRDLGPRPPGVDLDGLAADPWGGFGGCRKDEGEADEEEELGSMRLDLMGETTALLLDVPFSRGSSASSEDPLDASAAGRGRIAAGEEVALPVPCCRLRLE